jgi:hypothetical protein
MLGPALSGAATRRCEQRMMCSPAAGARYFDEPLRQHAGSTCTCCLATVLASDRHVAHRQLIGDLSKLIALVSGWLCSDAGRYLSPVVRSHRRPCTSRQRTVSFSARPRSRHRRRTSVSRTRSGQRHRCARRTSFACPFRAPPRAHARSILLPARRAALGSAPGCAHLRRTNFDSGTERIPKASNFTFRMV